MKQYFDRRNVGFLSIFGAATAGYCISRILPCSPATPKQGERTEQHLPQMACWCIRRYVAADNRTEASGLSKTNRA
jgi:hypothetical protein